MRGTLHHLVLTVSDPGASFPLYDAVLRELGYRLNYTTDQGFEWELPTPLGPQSIGIVRQQPGATAHNRYAPGLHHVAWMVESRGAVDRMHELLTKLGAHVLDAPAEYPQYNDGKGYYAVFFADADGLKLEVVFTPPIDNG